MCMPPHTITQLLTEVQIGSLSDSSLHPLTDLCVHTENNLFSAQMEVFLRPQVLQLLPPA